MRTLTLPLAIVEPSEPAAGAILVIDQDDNDIAEFYHCEHATVGQTYAEALQLAQALVASVGSRNVSGNENGKELPVSGKKVPSQLPKAPDDGQCACPFCFESSGYLWQHGNDWESGPWSHQTNIPCRECNGTGLVEAEVRTLDDLLDGEARLA